MKLLCYSAIGSTGPMVVTGLNDEKEFWLLIIRGFGRLKVGGLGLDSKHPLHLLVNMPKCHPFYKDAGKEYEHIPY